jgi:hypothetical protein
MAKIQRFIRTIGRISVQSEESLVLEAPLILHQRFARFFALLGIQQRACSS